MRVSLKILKWFLLTCLFAPAVLFLFLCFRTVEIPSFIKDHVESRLSASGSAASAHRVLFRLAKGLRIENARFVMDGCTATASRIDIEMDFFRLPWNWRKMVRSISVRDLSIPSLPSALPHSQAPSPSTLPSVRPFPVHFTNLHVLGIHLKTVDASAVEISPSGIRIEDIRAIWPDADVSMKTAGSFAYSAAENRIRASVHGQARQHNIRPLLEILDVRSSFEYIDAFTGVVAPVDASYSIDADLSSQKVSMSLDLHPSGGAYRGIPFKDVHSKLDISFSPDPSTGSCNASVKVGPLRADFADGTELSGTLSIAIAGDAASLHFDDIRSTLAISNAVTVSEALSQDLFSFAECSEPPEVTLSGTLDVTHGALTGGTIGGQCKIKNADLLDVSVSDADFAWSFSAKDGTEIKRFRSATAHGGTLAGAAAISTNGAFRVNVQAANVPLEDFADAFKTDIGDRHGTVNSTFSISGQTGEDIKHSLNGLGTIRCEHGHLAQLNLFSGFTDYLVSHVPGVANLVQQSRGTMNFAIKDGIFSTSNLLIEGDVFSIRSEGIYDIPSDSIDALCHVNLFRNDSLLSRLTSPISWTFNKLLLEFKVTGSFSSPSWQNASLIGGLGSKSSPKGSK